ncbi:hypothetical protein [Rhodoferax sp. BLA1]|uniref:hypothetical protein n=1 Tax=Rhodoferax sp. BLA1 TaxID=2576062 RepID=UPI0015D33EFE|nr:hypothetical protein [Rhodoferax sp. BLA1]
MHIIISLPPGPTVLTAVPQYWVQYFFRGTPSELYEVNALASTYLWLVEAAASEYQLASTALREFWATSESLDFPMLRRSISHFETCISDIHRAIDTYRRLRNHKSRDALSVHLEDHKPEFVCDKVAHRFRNVRDAIHHLPEKIGKGEVTEGQFFSLKPDGPEVPHPTEAGQTNKTFDRLVIGPHELSFDEIAQTLTDLAVASERIATFQPNRSSWGKSAF